MHLTPTGVSTFYRNHYTSFPPIFDSLYGIPVVSFRETNTGKIR